MVLFLHLYTIIRAMIVALVAVGFLYIATILGLFLKPTDAEIQAKNFTPPTAGQADDHSHHAHGH